MKSLVLRFAYNAFLIYWHIFKPETYGVRVIIEDKGRIVLVRHTYKKGYYFPGGAINRNETPEQAAIREVKEETGLTIKKVKHFATYKNTSEGKRDTIIVMKATGPFTIPLRRQQSEISELFWCDVNSLPADITKSTKKCLQDYLNNTPPPENTVWR